MSGNIKVVVRCRPLNSREKARGAASLVRMEGNKTILSKPSAQGGKPTDELKAFTFDQSYWSADKEDPDYADQEKVYNDLGRELLDHAFSGYNCCIFAYGQTGSGKSYSMMGYGEDKGIIPRTCVELFERIQEKKNDKLNFQVEVSYIEIYNEKVRDLLNPQNKANLKVREHPVTGPYVQDLSRLAVNSFENIDQLMDEGNKARTIAATNMNETSSRSHGVFTIFVTQKLTDPATKQTTEKVARISLVDLAGSERANSTGATGVRLKEGANINKSLTTLGKVIAGLAEQASADPKKGSKKSKEIHVPFRDSVLTWLLKDSLGGNSKTCMIAAISPADYDETLSTLRYADQAKKIRTKAVVNEDPTAKVMRELKDEVEALRQALMVYAPEEVEKITATAHPVKGAPKKPQQSPAAAGTLAPPPTSKQLSPSKSTVVFTDANGNTTQLTKDEMVDQLKLTEKLLTDMNQTWEEKLLKTEQIHVERENTLKKLGITIEKKEVGVYTPREIPYMINLNEDPLMSECLMYHIKSGKTFVVRLDDENEDGSGEQQDQVKESDDTSVIRLSGSNIKDKHCYFENINDTVTLYPGEDCTTMVNGRRISEPKILKSGYRIILGDHHVFRFNNPGEAMRERELQHQATIEDRNTDSPSPPSPTSEKESLTSALGSSEVMDWNFARREAMLNTYINDSNFGNFTDEDLDKLFDDVSKVRVLRKRQSTSSDTLSRRTSTSSVRRSTYSTSTSLFMEDSMDGYYTTDTSTISSTTSSSRESLLMMAQDERDFQLEHHRRKYEAKLRRLSRRLSQAPLSFTKAEIALGRKVIQLWKKKRNVAMAQVIFSNLENVKQANLMAARANKGVSYQFTVIHDNASAYSLSYWDTNNNSNNNNAQRTTDLALLKENKPCVAIKVIDKKHQSTYIWSVDKFLSRQRHLKGAYYSTDSKKQMKGEDLYYDTVVPAYTLVGLAKVPLKNLATQVPVDSALSVYCRNTGQLKGTVKVLIAPIARSVRQPYHSDKESASSAGEEDDKIENAEDDENSNLLHVGQQLVFEIRIVEINGIDPNEFSHVHAQFRLSTFGSNLDRVFASEPYQQADSSSSLFFDYHQTLSMTVTEDMLYIIENKDITFEIYGKPKPAYLDKLAAESNQTTSSNHTLLPLSRSQDIVAHIQICEITAEGDYKPVPVEANPTNEFTNDVFSLQQGQQRRIKLNIQHGSNDEEIRFDKIVNLRVGHVRLVDNKNRVTESPSQMEIPLNLISTTSSSTEISAQGSWDSSLHDTIFLNTITPSTHKVLLNLSWTLRNKSQSDIKFEKEISVVIKDQGKATSLKRKSTKRNSVIMNFFNLKPSHIKSQVTALYFVQHVADMMGVSQLWKQNLVTESLLNGYDEARLKMQHREDVELLRYRLYLSEQLVNPTLEENTNDAGVQLKKVQVQASSNSSVTPETVLNIWVGSNQKAEPVIPECQPKVTRWVPKVHQVILTGDCVSKKGFLTRKKKTNGEVEKLWCTLMGNYLFMYDDQHEVNIVDVLHINQVQAEESPANVSFKVDTLYESCVFQSQDNVTMKEWVSAIQK